MIIKKGSKIKVDYEGKFDDGTIFDSSKHGDHSHPLEFEVGSGQVIPGFDASVIGMKKGEEKEIIIEAKDAYGEVRAELIREFPRDSIPKDDRIKEGSVLMLGNPQGQQFPCIIKKLTADKVTIDLNHPLAGKRLHFKIKILEVA
ncbi:MAG: peptidylprolyl isomerase [archaeon]|nr:peptidylprolyl isomerase [archaeon]